MVVPHPSKHCPSHRTPRPHPHPPWGLPSSLELRQALGPEVDPLGVVVLRVCLWQCWVGHVAEVKALLHIQLLLGVLVIKPAHGVCGRALAAQLQLAGEAKEPGWVGGEGRGERGGRRPWTGGVGGWGRWRRGRERGEERGEREESPEKAGGFSLAFLLQV